MRGSTTTTYADDVARSLPVVLFDGNLRYVWGNGLAYAVDSTGDVQVFHQDGLGSVRSLTDISGNLLATYQTDEFGVQAFDQGGSAQPFGYAGEEGANDRLLQVRAPR